MKNLSIKSLLIIFFLLLIAVIILAKFAFPKQKVSAAWWNDGWNYRKAASISNTSGSNLTDFQVSISIGTSALIASGKMQNDCDDIRVTDINGNLLPYWIETNGLNACNQTNSVIWVKTTSLPTSDSTLYIYYGNPSTNSDSSGKDVFIFFDDFNNPTIDTNKWNLCGSMTSISGNHLRADRNNGTGSLFSKNTFSRPFVLDYDFYPTQYPSGWEGSYHGSISFGTYNTSYATEHAWIPYGGGGNSYCGLCDDGGCYHGSYVNPLSIGSTLYKISMQIRSLQAGPQGVMTYSNRRDENIGSSASSTVYTGATTGNDPLYIGVKDYGGNVSDDLEWDNWRVRKYASTTPTTTLQSEEVGGGPIAYWKFDEGIGTTAYDSTTNQNNGIISDATWANENQCISGKCLNFDGSNDFITIPQSSTINSLTEFTLSFWINHDGSNVDNYIFYKGAVSPNGSFAVRINGNDTRLSYWDVNGTVASTSYISVTPNQWHQVAFSFKANNQIKTYLDGKSVETISASSLRTNSENLYFNTYNGTTGSYNVKGLFDDVKIYPYARTAAQIKQDYNSRGSLKGSSANLGIKSSTAPSLNSKLIVYYKFDEGNGTIINNSINSGIGLSGVFATGSSAPTWTNNGKNGKALSFDGNDYINLPNNIGYSGQVSAIAWFKSSSSPPGSYHIIIGGSELEISIPTSGELRTGVYTNSRTVSNFGSGLTDGRWHRIGMTFDGTTKKSYIDGNFVGQTTGISGSLTYSFSSRTIGKFGSSSTYFLNGLIDELKIYNTALTTDEIKQDYNAGTATQFGSTSQTIGGTTTSLEYCIPGDTSYCASPIAEWNFEENTGTVAHDISGNNNNGTFGTGDSAPTWTNGKTGAGLNFDGTNDYITFPFYFYPTTFSINWWMYTTNRKDYNQVIGAINGQANYGWSYFCFHTTSTGQVYVGTDTSTRFTSTELPANTVQLNTWQYFTFTFDNGTANFYRNGILLASKTGMTSPIGNFGGIRTWSNSDNTISGKIDNIKIYNYARTPAQVAYDYNKGGPVGWWKLDECQGGTAFNSVADPATAGLGSTGTINIGASGTQNSLGTCQIGTSAAWTNGASGHTNSSLNFDGTDDYVNAGDISITNWQGLTVSLWLYWDGSTVSNYRVFLYKSSSADIGSHAVNSSGKLLVQNGNGNFFSNNNGDLLINQWSHYVYEYNQITGKEYIFINGFKKGEQIRSGDITQNSSPLQITRPDAYFYSGKIDDVRIYNYALTAEQIKQLYNGGAVNFN